MDMFNGFKTTCYRLFGDIPNLDIIAQFLMIICGVKYKGKYPYDASIKEKAELVVKLVQEYSNLKFQRLFELQELGFLIKYLHDNHNDRLFKFTQHMQSFNDQVFAKTIESWIFKFEEGLAKPSKDS